MVVPKLEKQQVLGALKATGSTDPDVLFARKEEMLAESRRNKLLGVFPVFVGAVMTVTIVGAVVGVPAIWFGLSVRKTIKNNTKVADEALAEYLASLSASSSVAPKMRVATA